MKRIFLLNLLLLLAVTPAFAKKDCSKTKTMAELKQCDSVQYEETQRILNSAQSKLNDSSHVQAEANQALENHNNTLHQVNDE